MNQCSWNQLKRVKELLFRGVQLYACFKIQISNKNKKTMTPLLISPSQLHFPHPVNSHDNPGNKDRLLSYLPSPSQHFRIDSRSPKSTIRMMWLGCSYLPIKKRSAVLYHTFMVHDRDQIMSTGLSIEVRFLLVVVQVCLLGLAPSLMVTMVSLLDSDAPPARVRTYTTLPATTAAAWKIIIRVNPGPKAQEDFEEYSRVMM